MNCFHGLIVDSLGIGVKDYLAERHVSNPATPTIFRKEPFGENGEKGLSRIVGIKSLHYQKWSPPSMACSN